MSTARIPLRTLQQIPAFHDFNESECHQLFEVTQEKTFAPGEKVIEQGKRSQNLWILMEGKCEVIKNRPRDGAVVLAELEPFNFFGELSFFSPAPHSASVIAQTPVRLLCISRTDYDDLIHDGVGAAYKVAFNVVERVADRLRRMDEWITKLSVEDGHSDAEAPEILPEWRQFREKVFDGWSL